MITSQSTAPAPILTANQPGTPPHTHSMITAGGSAQRALPGRGRGSRDLVDELLQVPPSVGDELRRGGEGQQMAALAAVLVGLVQHLSDRDGGLRGPRRHPER